MHMPRGKPEPKRTTRYSDAEKQLFKSAGWEVYPGHYADEAYLHDARTDTCAYIEDPRNLDWAIEHGNNKVEEPIVEGFANTVAEAIEEVKAAFQKLPPK